MSELFLNYFKKRWEMEKEKSYPSTQEDELLDFIYAPAAAKQKCTELVTFN